MLISLNRLQSIIKRSGDRNLEVETEAEIQLIGLLNYKPGPCSCLEMDQSKMGWAIQKLIINKESNPTNLPTGKSDGENTSIEIHSSQVTLSLCHVHKN